MKFFTEADCDCFSDLVQASIKQSALLDKAVAALTDLVSAHMRLNEGKGKVFGPLIDEARQVLEVIARKE